jgi:hypothetical protein
MSTYIRFQTNVQCPHMKRPLGVFHAAGVLQARGRIQEYFRDTINETLDWYDNNLVVPRIADRDQRCVFWFCADKQQIVANVWSLVAILVEHQVDIRRLRTTDPGMIVYRDAFQVAAIPNQRVNKALQV